MIFFVTDFFHRRKFGRRLEELKLQSAHAIEVLALLVASCWYLVIIGKGTLSLTDSVVLGGAFVFYLWLLNRLPAEDEEAAEDLLGPPRLLVSIRTRWVRAPLLVVLFFMGGTVMWAVAHPFLDAMKEVALAVGVSEFAFVQWLAPFLTEFPEKLTALYWSRTVRLAPMALLNMISSTVNQYTALVAMIPVAFALSVGSAHHPIVMDVLHKREMFLSFATTLYGCACLMKLSFTRANALVMLVLFLAQFFYSADLPLPGGWAVNFHDLISGGYLVAAIFELWVNRHRLVLWKALRDTQKQMR